MRNARENRPFGTHADDAAVAQETHAKCLDSQRFDASGVQNEQAISGQINPAFSRSSRRVLDTLTAAQQSVLDYLQSFQMAKGFPPTRAEISRHFGWTSANAAHEHLQSLQRKGRVRLLSGTSRGIRVITETETLSLPQRAPLQLQAIRVRKIWDTDGVHSPGFPDALARLLEMIEKNEVAP